MAPLGGSLVPLEFVRAARVAQEGDRPQKGEPGEQSAGLLE